MASMTASFGMGVSTAAAAAAAADAFCFGGGSGSGGGGLGSGLGGGLGSGLAGGLGSGLGTGLGSGTAADPSRWPMSALQPSISAVTQQQQQQHHKHFASPFASAASHQSCKGRIAEKAESNMCKIMSNLILWKSKRVCWRIGMK